MKKRFLLFSSLVAMVGVATYLTLGSKAIAVGDTVEGAPKVEQVANPTVQAFTEEFQKSPSSAVTMLDGQYPDDYIVFHHPKIGGYLISPPSERSSGPELDENFNEIPGTDISFTAQNSTTIGELKQVVKELEN